MKITETITIEFDSYELLSVTDYASEKKAIARLKLLQSGEFVREKLLTLWEGNDYDSAGQFTDIDITSRIQFLLTQ